jgi:Uri superfamily endonuclease
MTENRAGTYALVTQLGHERVIQVGRLGRFRFEPGWYLYVGSALGPGGLQARIERHARAEKRLHWHIDYLLAQGELREAWVVVDTVRRECDWARALAALPDIRIPVPGFGASDCRCGAHLFRASERPRLDDLASVLRDALFLL